MKWPTRAEVMNLLYIQDVQHYWDFGNHKSEKFFEYSNKSVKCKNWEKHFSICKNIF